MSRKDAQRVSVTRRFRARERGSRLDGSDLGPGRISDFVAKLLDESDAIEFRTAERILDALERQGRTLAGYPRVRPVDCDHFLHAMRLVFDAYRRSFIIADPRIVRRFEDILEAFEKTDVRFYPRELMRARTVGVQPYARDTYKNHQEIGQFVAALGERYDVIVFHHIETSVAGPGMASTAGLTLAQSIALVSGLDALVCVDSAFLHAAAAFDVPVVAMFGPTDGVMFTRHHRRAKVIDANERFSCAPCWRNEDLPCSLTGGYGPSPCVAAIKVEPVLAAVEAALRPASRVSAAAAAISTRCEN